MGATDYSGLARQVVSNKRAERNGKAESYPAHLRGDADESDHAEPGPGYSPFPLDALPAPLGEYVRQAAVALGCDASYLALPAMTACAGCIGNTRRIMLKRSWSEPCVIWTGIIGESGTLKSPAIEAVMRPLYAAQRVMVEEHRGAMGDDRRDLARHGATSKPRR